MKKVNVLKCGLCSLLLLSGTHTAFSQEMVKQPLEPQTEILIVKASEHKEKAFLGVGIEGVEAGVQITEIYDFSAAAAAGLLSGDIITSIDGEKISTVEDLQEKIRQHQIGDEIQVNYLRKGQAATATARLKAQKKASFNHQNRRRHKHHEPLTRAERYNNYKYNHHYYYKKYHEDFDACAELKELKATPFIGVYVDLDQEKDGVDITSTIDGTDAPNSDLEKGDQILKINRFNVSDFESLREVLSKFEPGERVRIKYARDGISAKTAVTLSSMASRYPYKVKKLEQLCAEQQAVDEIITKENKKENSLPIIKAPVLEVFPNPAVDIVNIKFEGGLKTTTTILVLDIQGKEVMRQLVNENPEQFNTQLNLSSLASGSYIISVQQGEQITSKQISLK